MKLTSHPAWWGIVFLAYSLESLAWASSINYPALGQLALLACAFVVGWFFQSLLWLYGAFVIAMTVNVGAAIMQQFNIGFVQWAIQYPSGFFGNSNYLACALALACAIALAERWFWFLPVGAIGLWLTGARGAMLAAGAAGVAWLWPRSRWAIALIAPLLVVALVIASEHKGPTGGAWARIGIWQSTLDHLSIFGSGWGSFASFYSALPIRINMTEFVTEHAYNDYLELIFELGIGSVALWAMLGLGLERAAETERLVLIAFAVLALTYFPLHLFLSGPIAALALGHSLAERKLHGSLAADQSPLPQHR